VIGEAGKQQHSGVPLPFGTLGADREASYRAHIVCALDRNPADLPVGLCLIVDPLGQVLDELLGAAHGVILATHGVAAFEQEGERANRAAATIDANEGPAALEGGQAQHLFGAGDQVGQDLHEQGIARVERIADDLTILAGEDAARFSSPAAAGGAEVALDTLLSVLTGWHAGQVDIQHEPGGAKGVLCHLALAMHEHGEYLLHLLDVLGSGGVQRLLGYGLLGAACAPVVRQDRLATAC
jgi:hypothetical protein